MEYGISIEICSTTSQIHFNKLALVERTTKIVFIGGLQQFEQNTLKLKMYNFVNSATTDKQNIS
jgi:hypothetical protein